MTSFLSDVIKDLKEKHQDLSKLTIILPSKRAGDFFRKELMSMIDETLFSPFIYSIEEFVTQLSKLQPITNLELLFEFYEVYKAITPQDEIEPLDQVSGWAQLLLNDFNEVDRFLVEPDSIFNYLSAIKELNHWSMEDNQTDSVKRYMAFWKRLALYYTQLQSNLKNQQKGYQGLIYREAVNHLDDFIAKHNNEHIVFIGFNALNKAEETIFETLLNENIASVYWDIDETFLNNPLHDAGLFTRQYKDAWNYYERFPFHWASSNYSKPKNINVVGAPKQIGQVKYLSNLLSQLSQNNTLKNTAVVLGDETLLLPILNAIPEDIRQLNITMGLPISKIPLSDLFELLFKIHKASKEQYYYKDVINLFSNPFIRLLINTDKALNNIQDNNIAYLSYSKLEQLFPEDDSSVLNLLLSSWNNNPRQAIDNCIELIWLLKQSLDSEKEKNNIELEYLFRFYKLFNELKRLSEANEYLESIKSLQSLYRELIQSESLDFKGNPFDGLQIMGMLETRVLDFETVIITSVNEGILPSGKSGNSFIPFDVKLQNFLPTYKEKDAIYTYHFYRLLQRAKNVFIIYNTEADVLNGGEKSRFIRQLDIESIHQINQSIAAPILKSSADTLKVIEKSPEIVEDLKALAQKGFSPSALTNYVRNPIDFYHEKLLGIKRYEEVEETLASNTLGNIIHKTLEDLYLPIKGKTLEVEALKAMYPKIDSLVVKHFKVEYKQGDFTKGKNLIIFEIAKRYVENFISKEIEFIKAGNTIEILGLEESVETLINIPNLNFPVKLKGIVDRIDRCNGVIRVIDYKTGKVEQSKVEVIDWDALTTDYTKYSKSFQVLTYALMLSNEDKISLPVEGGIISFKNLKSGLLKFAKKDKPGAYANKDTAISQDTLDNFQKELQALILEIFDPKIPFKEKEL
ncbi:PD-(D/E)XK nuclease family protein [Winogradskyella sp. 3972H.M.0a.05]|uniref:PD-(D/E)XK nuclease family protein n=1 Tax=Winogradskyella sp. 3972H.M.0a.05 TaxID=2950277 RepID=UPI0033973963